MALSAEESKKLLDAIQNLNVSAEVIQEVLQLIRNAGHTGAVDIAEHNNTPGAHPNDSALLHVANSIAYLGEIDTIRGKKNILSMIGQGGTIGNGYNTSAKSNGDVSTVSGQIVHANNLYSTTSDGIPEDLATISAQLRLMGYDSWRLYGVTESQYCYAGLHFYAGFTENGVRKGPDSKKSCIRPTLSTGEDYGTFTQSMEFSNSAFTPLKAGVVQLGYAATPFSDVYSQNAVTVTSDARVKKDVSDMNTDKTLAFIKALRPVRFKYISGAAEMIGMTEQGEPISRDIPGQRDHYGLVAQEVKNAMEAAGIDDAALWCLTDKTDPDSKQSIRYTELIAPMLKVIQMQQERIEALEARLK